jgi:peptide chain release factor 1
MNLAERFQQIKARFNEISTQMGDPSVFKDQKAYTELTKEHSSLKALVDEIEKWDDLKSAIDDNKALISANEEPELTDMARDENKELIPQLEQIEEEIRFKLIPKDPEDSKNAIVEIRAGTGGDEAAIFAGDLFEMYRRLADRMDWKLNLMNLHESEKGGYRELSFELEGIDVFAMMKYESGVHRVQRVPATESQGRVHTSAATVAVLPEVDEVDVEVRKDDLKVDTFRASGAGGQHVNKTDSAIRITHIPTGIVVECQEERSQFQNKERALKMLYARMYEAELERINAVRAKDRKDQVSTGDRSAKIRTYNYPQGRVTDHRIGLTLYNLDDTMKGAISEVIKALRVHDHMARMMD